MAGTGDQESPRQQRPPRLPAPARTPGPGGHPAPSGRSRGLGGCGRAPGAGTAATRDFTPPSWEPAARYSQQCTSCFKKSERVCWPRGARSSRGASERAGERGAAVCITGHLACDCPAGVRSTRLASPGPASPCRPRLQSSVPVRAAGRTSLPAADSTAPGSPGVGSRHLAFASLQPHLPYPASASQEKNHLREGVKTKPELCPGRGRLRVCKSGKFGATSQQIHAQQGASFQDGKLLVLC